MENPTHHFGETNLALPLVWEKQIKIKNEISWSLRKKYVFCNVLFVQNFFLTFIFYLNVQWIEYFLKFYIMLHVKNITSNTFLLVFKIVESLQCIVNDQNLLSLIVFCQCCLTDVKTITLFIFELLTMYISCCAS